MMFRLVDRGWGKELDTAVRKDASAIEVISPFIKRKAAERFLTKRAPHAFRVLTRFNLSDFSQGVSDTAALRMLLEHGAQIRGIRNLHAKLYILGSKTALVTSANLTAAALSRNHEFGFVAHETPVIDHCRSYFDALWSRAGPNLAAARIDRWDRTLAAYWASGAPPRKVTGLGDDGVDIGLTAESPILTTSAVDVTQGFVKFFGEGSNRAELAKPVIEEVRRCGCHWACSYPKGKRPRQVEDGALMFIARLTKQPSDARIFGRAIGLAHLPERDDATAEEIKVREWKETWPHYVRVHHAEFVAGRLENGVSLNELMDTLRSDAFATTQKHARARRGNIDPYQAYRQQPSVELSSEGIAWLSAKLDAAFARHGRLAQADLNALDWPRPEALSPGRTLSQNGLRLLRVLIQTLRNPSVRIEQPRTFPTYLEALRAMGVTPVRGPGLGSQFEREGGLDLNDWLREMQLPAITGLVVRGDTHRPGDNYFISNGRVPPATRWWRAQIRLAVGLDWSTYCA